MHKKIWIAAILAVLFVTVFEVNMIPSGSMEPTIKTGDFVLSTRHTNIKRYDVIVFKRQDGKHYIKRVIGLPGEQIVLKDGMVYADGEALDDSFTAEGTDTDGDMVFDVPEDCYFVLGDNRNNSLDSRYWEEPFVSASDVEAKAWAVFFPIQDIKGVNYPDRDK